MVVPAEPIITAVDTNIFSDVLAGIPTLADISRRAVQRADADGFLVMSVVSYSELAGSFNNAQLLKEFLDSLPVTVSPLDEETAFLGGLFHHEYRKRGGARIRILPDFLIAAHAQLYAHRILTRDHRFFGGSFPGLKAVAPEDLQPNVTP